MLKSGRDYLKLSVITGTVCIIYAVCTVNIFLVIAMICSWTAFWGNKPNAAKAALIFYILGELWSLLVLKALYNASLGFYDIVMKGLGELISGMMTYIVGGTAVFSVLVLISALCSAKGMNVKEEKAAVEYYSGGGVRR